MVINRKKRDELIDRKAVWYAGGGLYLNVWIHDARETFGRVDFLIVPLPAQGRGERWVAESTIELLEDETSQDSITATISP